MLFPVTTQYAGILGLWMVVLALRVGKMRTSENISLGSEGSPALFEAIRGHANFTEWVPFTVVLMGLTEADGLGRTWLHIAGAVLVIARLAHPFGLKSGKLLNPLRAIGAVLTSVVTVGLSGFLIWRALM